MRPISFSLTMPLAVVFVSVVVAGSAVPVGAVPTPPEVASPLDGGPPDPPPPAPDDPDIAPEPPDLSDVADTLGTPDEPPAPADDPDGDDPEPPEPREIVQQAVADADDDGVPDESAPLLDADGDGRLDPVQHVQEASAAFLALLADGDDDGVPDPADEGWGTAVATILDLYRSIADPVLAAQPDADGDGIADALDGEGDGDDGAPDLDGDDDGRVDAFASAQDVLVGAFGGHDGDGDGIPDALDGGDDGAPDLDGDDDGTIDALKDAQGEVLDLVREHGVIDLDADDDGVPDPVPDGDDDPYRRLAQELASVFDELAGGGLPPLDDDPENGVPDPADGAGAPDPYSTARDAAVALFDQLGTVEPTLDLDPDGDGVPDDAQSDGDPSFETLRGAAVTVLDTGGGGVGPDLDPDGDGVPDDAQSDGEPSFETLREAASEAFDALADTPEQLAAGVEGAVDENGDGYPDAAAALQAEAAGPVGEDRDADDDGLPNALGDADDPDRDEPGELHDTLIVLAATFFGDHDADDDGVPNGPADDPDRDDLGDLGSSPGSLAPVLALFADPDGDGIPAALEPVLDGDADEYPDAAAAAQGESAGGLDEMHGAANEIPPLPSPPSSTTTTTTVPPTTTTTAPDESDPPPAPEAPQVQDRDSDTTGPAPVAGTSEPNAGEPTVAVAGERLARSSPVDAGASANRDGRDDGDEAPDRELAVPAVERPPDRRGPAGWLQGLAWSLLAMTLAGAAMTAYRRWPRPGTST